MGATSSPGRISPRSTAPDSRGRISWMRRTWATAASPFLTRQAEWDTRLHLLDGIGATPWLAARDSPFDWLQERTVDVHGTPHAGDSRRLVSEALGSLHEAGLLSRRAPRPST